VVTTAQQIYQDLINAGMSSAQAAGVEGNMESESSLNPEANAMDSNGKRSYGLIQWNAGSYPSASKLVTGNVSADIAAQIQYLLHDTNNISKGLNGTTAAQVAGNFAQYVEVCQGCNPGGSSYNKRVAQAQQLYNEAVSGNWGSSNGTLNLSGSATTAQDASTTTQNAGLAETFMGWLLNAFGVPDLKDLMERLGLILLGGALVAIGFVMININLAKGVSNSFNEHTTGPERSLLMGSLGMKAAANRAQTTTRVSHVYHHSQSKAPAKSSTGNVAGATGGGNAGTKTSNASAGSTAKGTGRRKSNYQAMIKKAPSPQAQRFWQKKLDDLEDEEAAS
jgi:Phage tail lysozyme